MRLQFSIFDTVLLLVLPIMVRTRSSVNLTLNETSNGESLRLAFGSCFRIFDYKNDMFRTVTENRPHLWTWMGDAAYTDNVKQGSCKDDVTTSYCFE